MTPQDLRNQRRMNFKQTNAYAMQYGLIMGAYVLATQACFVLGLSISALMSLQTLLTFLYPVAVLALTFRFRKIVCSGLDFPFGRGFSFSLLVILYSGVWAALSTFIYLQLFDHGYLFETYLTLIKRPDMVHSMQQSGLTAQVQSSTGGLTPIQLVEQLSHISPSVFAAVTLYFFLISAPVLSAIIGLFTMRRATRVY